MMQKHQARAIVVILLLVWSSLLSAAPKAVLIPFWNVSNEASTATIDHSVWQTILTGYLNTNHSSAIHRFNYAALKDNVVDSKKLDDYLSSLQQLEPRSYSKAEQKAYWINLYNALTIQVVLAAYPVKSITQIHQGWFSFGPWNDVLAEVAEQKLTLNHIEHGILRPIWNDPRVHYAVNCASFGCPNLSPKAYTAANMEKLLEQAAKEYVNHPRGVKFLSDDYLMVSSIYRWYRSDFDRNDGGVIAHLVRYARPSLAMRLNGFKGTIDHDYDWKLNRP